MAAATTLHVGLQSRYENIDPHIHSRMIFANTVHEVCQKNGYYDEKIEYEPEALGFYSVFEI